jgi:aminomethyltransferase
VEAGLEWAIQPARRRGGAREGGFPGADVILGQVEAGPDRRRVGLRPEGRAPMREGVELMPEEGGEGVGRVTSGGFSPTLNAPIAMGYVPAALAAPETRLLGRLRGRDLPVTVARMPFIKPGYRR